VSRARQKREAAGRRAERLAAFWLQLKGYRILAKRYRAPGGEIDLIAAWPFLGKPRLIAFVEVKQRRAFSDFAEAISPTQRRRIEAGGDAWLGANPRHAEALCRYDAMFVAPARFPRHIKALWRRGD